MNQKEKVSYYENVLKVGNLQVIAENTIKEVIVSDDLIFALLDDQKNGKLYARNIVAYDFNGQLKWQVEDIGGPVGRSWFFNGIYISQEGHLMGYNWNDHTYKLENQTGRIIVAEKTN